jgi:hypothetical protein
MKVTRIIAKIETGIQDPSFTIEDDILPLVNDFVDEVSELFTVPELQDQDTVSIEESATENSIPMPDDYGRDMYRVYSSLSLKEVNIRGSLKVLERLYTGQETTDFIQDVVVVGKALWFRPLPVTAQDLTLYYYRKPVPVEFDDADDEDLDLDGIPSHLAKVAVDYALKELWALVEDGIDGKKINTAYYTDKYNIGLAKIAEHCKGAPKCVPVVTRSARFF